ncbi:MAG: metallophosphoesterase [Pirellulales bacterium]|nr:metallophosphoesterase [Pirellulales bacterium]
MLVQPLFDGPLDIVADVHGELDSLRQLLAMLGYDEMGRHAAGRRLVFLGDLTDRGPDSPGVVRLVAELVFAGKAQALLGNHELNILLGHPKHGNHWFWGEPEVMDGSGRMVPQRLADEAVRREAWALFESLPLVLCRPDLCLVHACWQEEMVSLVQGGTSAVELYEAHDRAIREELDSRQIEDKVERALQRQNRNPVKVLTSGLECKASQPFWAQGRWRKEQRVAWWQAYQGERFCVFGHYSRRLVPREERAGDVFHGTPPLALLGGGRAMCIDYAVASRWERRMTGVAAVCEELPLAALRWPEGELVLEDGRRHVLAGVRDRAPQA